MQVWVVQISVGSASEIMGIFSSQEKAQDFIRRQPPQPQCFYEIWEVDKKGHHEEQ